jgi:hypothetical protein
MTRGGWKLFHVPEARIEHRHGASVAKNPAVSLAPLNAARELFIQLNQPSRFQLLLHDATRFVGFAVRAIYFFARSFFAGNDRDRWRMRARTFARYAQQTCRR